MKGAIRWFCDNSVAANILMVLVLLGGGLTLTSLRQEIFPEFSADLVTVAVPYPGATPAEIEESICVKIEEAIQAVDGVKEIRSASNEGSGVVTVEVDPGADVRRVLDDVKTLVDAISTFPEDAEKPIIQEVLLRKQVLSVAVFGDADELTLRRLGERVRDEISALDDITQVELVNVRPYEISIELSEETLRRYGLTFDEVANAVRRSSLDLPGGSIKTRAGEILLRTKGQAYTGEDFARLALRTAPDGTRLLLGDVARVVDGFAEVDRSAHFDGQPSTMVQVYRVGEEDALRVAEAVHRYVDRSTSWLPAGIGLTVWDDSSVYLRGRRDLLLRNGATGLALVFLVLTLFLRIRLALWVSLGIPVSFLGAIWLMPALGVTINLVTLFAFILVLGIVVDDAIVVGENVYTHFRRHGDGFRAAVEGTQEVAVPVIFGVLTTVAAFIPLLTVPGATGKIWKTIPLIVIPVLLFSVLESKFVLPAHLKHMKPETRRDGDRPGWQERFARGFENFVQRRYRPALDAALRWRYLTIFQGIALFVLTIGIVAGGWIKFSFMPPVEADRIRASLEMPLGTSFEETTRAAERLEKAALELRTELDGQVENHRPSVFRHVLTSIGSHPSAAERRGPASAPEGNFDGANLAEVSIELVGGEHRDISSNEISRRWRERCGTIPGVKGLSFESSLFHAGDAINIQLSSPDIEELEQVTASLQRELAEFEGVSSIGSSYDDGKQEIRLRITPEGETLGLDQVDLARQVRQAFYGEEAQRIQRGRDELKVMVRYPREHRLSLAALRNMRIRLSDGTEVPLTRVADLQWGRGFATINRVDRQRVINVTADVDQELANANEILGTVTAEVLPRLLRDHPGVRWSLQGEQKEQRESMGGLVRGFVLALFMIYALMAIPLRSYLHPSLILAGSIPLGLVGAVWGHLLMGMGLSILSVVGMVALTGVVVNDGLVLVDAINRRRREGEAMGIAVREAAVSRFRPILLTSLTTFAGLTPILLERSMQARFLIPLAISLAFGVVFATVVTLFILPSLYLVLEDLSALAQRRRSRADHHPRGANEEPPVTAGVGRA